MYSNYAALAVSLWIWTKKSAHKPAWLSASTTLYHKWPRLKVPSRFSIKLCPTCYLPQRLCRQPGNSSMPKIISPLNTENKRLPYIAPWPQMPIGQGALSTLHKSQNVDMSSASPNKSQMPQFSLITTRPHGFLHTAIRITVDPHWNKLLEKFVNARLGLVTVSWSSSLIPPANCYPQIIPPFCITPTCHLY